MRKSINYESFNQNDGHGGFEVGSYDTSSVHPTVTNWTRKSRFQGPDIPVEQRLVTFEGVKKSSNIVSGRNGIIYFGGYDGYLYAILCNGEILWKLDLKQPIGTPTISKDEIIYVATIDESYRFQGYRLFAINIEGKVLWEFPVSSSVLYPPVIDKDGFIYIVLEDNELQKVASSGILQWTFKKNIQFWSAPILSSDGVIVIGCCDSTVYGLNKKGDEIWATKIGHGMPDYIPVISVSGIVYITASLGEQRKLIAIKTNGEYLWEFTPECGEVWTNISYNSNTLYFYSSFFKLMAVNQYKKILWEIKLEGFTNYPPIIDKYGNIYICTHNEIKHKANTCLYCIDAIGNIKWEYKTIDISNSFIISENSTIYLLTNNFLKGKTTLHIIGNK